MKIFSSFDSKLRIKEYKKFVNTFWEDKVLLISRCFFFFLFIGIIPFFIWLIFCFGIFLWFLYTINIYLPLAIWILIIWIILFIILLYKLFIVFLSYKYDFTIVTPEALQTHKQKWLFNYNYKDIPVEKIKTIQARNIWIIWSVFNYWNMTILMDWWVAAAEDIEYDEQWSWAWQVRLTFVNRPNKIKEQILMLCFRKLSLSDYKEEEED